MEWRAKTSARIEQQLHTNNASHLPSPGCPLVVILDDDSEVPAIRPQHVESREGDPGYRTPEGMPLDNVVRWRYA
tara:strand:+ start:378 stop:602 length:225 start_codon:yes stop_codon:yes gene_type:complete